MKNYIRISNVILLYIAVFVLSIVACQKEEESIEPAPVIHERGEILASFKLGSYTADDILQIVNSTMEEFPFELKHKVVVYLVQYYTVDCNNTLHLASGAIAIPDGIQNIPLLSIQHGTETLKDKVASVDPSNSTEGMAILIAGSMGYYAISSDYLGFGVSDIPHPYMHAESLVPSVIDFIRAGRSFAGTKQIGLDDKLFLTGYSEGGFASLATQKAIEEQYPDEFNITANAPMSGPYDLKHMIQDVFTSNDYPHAAYLAYFFKAYNEIYEWNRLTDFFIEPYSSSVSGLFNGSKSWGEVINQIPASMIEVINASFVNNYLEGKEGGVASVILDNTLLDWTPIAPIHFFYGDADMIVPYYHAENAMAAFTANGATQVQLTTIPGGTHESAGQEALGGAFQWFETMR